MVAAEKREFAGLLRRLGPAQPLEFPQAAFACRIAMGAGATILLANGPGPRLVRAMLDAVPIRDWGVGEIVSTGFCGALDPKLKVGDIVTDGVWSEDRVAVTAEDKRKLRERTGAHVVEMEFAAVQAKAAEWGLPCRAVRVVSDTAQEDLPLDLNLYRDAEGRFQLRSIAIAGLVRPFTVLPGLVALNRNSRIASEKLGEFFVNS